MLSTKTQGWFNVGPASATLDQHLTNIGSVCRVSWVSVKFTYHVRCFYSQILSKIPAAVFMMSSSVSTKNVLLEVGSLAISWRVLLSVLVPMPTVIRRTPSALRSSALGIVLPSSSLWLPSVIKINTFSSPLKPEDM